MTPYNDTRITEAQFKLDEPSRVKIDPTNVTVDGASGIELFLPHASTTPVSLVHPSDFHRTSGFCGQDGARLFGGWS